MLCPKNWLWTSYSYVILKNRENIIIKDWIEIWSWYSEDLFYFQDTNEIYYVWIKDWKRIIYKNWEAISKWYKIWAWIKYR